jgi:L-alanine-DL-glutamate epimerase-like enolase superfamily enzyme
MSFASTRSTICVESLDVSAYKIPTDSPESDGTFAWNATTVVVVEATAGETRCLGLTYADTATARLIQDLLLPVVVGRDAFAVGRSWVAMVEAIRNLGRPGIASMAISAVDFALWDLKARLLGLPLVSLLGMVRPAVPVYGSGGFTSYSPQQLTSQLGGWAEQGFSMVKMKIGREPEQDVDRVRQAREAIGSEVQLFVDANGAYARKEALALAEKFAEFGVVWFEEPVSSDDLAGLHLLRDRLPAGMEVAAGEYGYDGLYFRRMLEAESVDVLQADATRCAGITGFLQADALCAARSMPLSAHCGPAIHVHVCCAAPQVRHLEYFHDHARIDRLIFDGAPEPRDGMLAPDTSRPGNGLRLKRQDAERWRIGF